MIFDLCRVIRRIILIISSVCSGCRKIGIIKWPYREVVIDISILNISIGYVILSLNADQMLRCTDSAYDKADSFKTKAGIVGCKV